MAAKGTESKNVIFSKLLECFPGSFMYNDGKECRINMVEDGNEIQIKVALTAAKTPVTPDGSIATAPVKDDFNWESDPTPAAAEPTDQEKENLRLLAAKLGF